MLFCGNTSFDRSRRELPDFNPLMRLFVDASNIAQGGGENHLRRLFKHLPENHGFSEILILCSPNLRDAQHLQTTPVVRVVVEQKLGGVGVKRKLAHEFIIGRLLRTKRYDVLFSPGGWLPRRIPRATRTVIMSRNLLPFERKESRRYGLWSRETLRYYLLHHYHRSACRRADHVIFLSHYGREVIKRFEPSVVGKSSIIPHGLDADFHYDPSRRDFSTCRNWLYVSQIEPYKHQESVLAALEQAAAKGEWSGMLRLVGPCLPFRLPRLRQVLGTTFAQSHVRWDGAVDPGALPAVYRQADAFLWASTCENFPNVVLEAMGSGLPIVSSDRRPMPEILQDAAVYCDPERPESIAKAVSTLFRDQGLRARLARRAYERAQGFTAERCAEQTFETLQRVATSR